MFGKTRFFEVYMLNSVCEKMPPCGTLFLNWCFVDLVFLKICVVAFLDVVCN